MMSDIKVTWCAYIITLIGNKGNYELTKLPFLFCWNKTWSLLDAISMTVKVTVEQRFWASGWFENSKVICSWLHTNIQSYQLKTYLQRSPILPACNDNVENERSAFLLCLASLAAEFLDHEQLLHLKIKWHYQCPSIGREWVTKSTSQRTFCGQDTSRTYSKAWSPWRNNNSSNWKRLIGGHQ